MRFSLIPIIVSFLAVDVGSASAGIEADELREEVDRLVEQKEWSKAERAIRRLRAKVKGANRSKLDGLLHRVKGERAWEGLMKSVKSSTKPRVVIAKIDGFLQKYGEVEELAKRAVELKKEARSRIYFTIEDFESDDADLDPDLELLTRKASKVGVKEGNRAARWFAPPGEQSIYFECGVQDWRPFQSIVLWVHSKKKGGRLTVDVLTDEENYFEAWNNIGWVGWKEVRIPFRGKGARFRKERNPSWKAVSGLRIWKAEGKAIEILLDDLRLEKIPPKGKKSARPK